MADRMMQSLIHELEQHKVWLKVESIAVDFKEEVQAWATSGELEGRCCIDAQQVENLKDNGGLANACASAVRWEASGIDIVVWNF